MKPIDCVIIPARGGSKRIEHKNLQPFCGIPMLERSIKLAKMVSDYVIVSSDDLAILAFAKLKGAYPLMRDKALADDITPTLPVIIHALFPLLDKEAMEFATKIKEKEEYYYNNMIENIPLQISLHSKVLCLYATAMFATEDMLLESCAMIDKNPQASYIVSIVELAKVFRSFTCNDSGFLEFMFPQFINTRSQDLPKAFFDAGQFYLGYTKSFLEKIPLLGQKSLGIELEYAHDIDTPLDLIIAESLFTSIKGRK